MTSNLTFSSPCTEIFSRYQFESADEESCKHQFQLLNGILKTQGYHMYIYAAVLFCFQMNYKCLKQGFILDRGIHIIIVHTNQILIYLINRKIKNIIWFPNHNTILIKTILYILKPLWLGRRKPTTWNQIYM